MAQENNSIQRTDTCATDYRVRFSRIYNLLIKKQINYTSVTNEMDVEIMFNQGQCMVLHTRTPSNIAQNYNAGRVFPWY